MKQVLKKTVVVISTMAIAVSLFAGCAKKTETTNTPAQSGQPTQAAVKDDKPLEIKMLSQLFENAPDMNNAWWTEFQKRTNTKWTIEWVPSGDYGTKLDMVLASGDLPDLLVGDPITRPSLVSAVKKGAFWDLSSILGDFSKYPNLKNNPTKNAWKYVTVDGKIWGIPRSRPQLDPGIKIRKDWLDKLNIAMPTTLDEYKAALKKMVEGDPDGNGKKDTLGLVGDGFIMQNTDATILAGFGGYQISRTADGGMIHTNLTDAYADYVEYWRGFYADGLLSKEFSAMKQTQAQEMFLSGRVASYTRNIWRDYSFEQDIKKVQPEAKVVTIPAMKGPKAYAAKLEPGVYGAFYISKKVPQDKAKRIVDFYEKTCSPEWLDIGYFGFEGVHFTLVDGQKTLNEVGKKEVGTSVQQPIPMMANTWAKVFNPAAPKAYNDAKLKEVESIQKEGALDPFFGIVSDTWTANWPKYEKEWQSNVIKAIVGQISMDEYRSYVKKIREMPEFQKAFKEFGTAREAIFGKE